MKQEKNIWEQSRVELFQKLDCRETGLSQEDAADRLAKYGANELHAGKQKSVLQIFLGQFADFLVLILILAAVISACMGDVESMIVILAVITMNAILGTVQTVKASASLDSLKQMSAPTAKVLRDGQIVQIPGREVVPGDVVILEAGDSVCADGRLLECASLKCAESALTGESLPVEKDTEPLSGETALGDRKNMVFSGSFVTYGRGRFLVTATGMDTEMGKIAQLLKNTEERKTPLQVSLDQFGRKLSIIILVICAVLFGVSVLWRHENVMNAFLFAVALAVAAIPEALSSIVTIVLSFGTRKMAREHAIIRHLQAVEGLGSVSVICSDKTGTLTQNRMTVRKLYTGGEVIDAKDADFRDPLQEPLLRTALLCSDAVISGDTEIGDPTETALVRLGETNGFDEDLVRNRWPRLTEIPFDSDRKMMSTVHKLAGGLMLVTKGATDVLLDRCVVTPEERARIEQVNEQFSNEGLRVLAFACRSVDGPAITLADENSLTFLGLIAMMDPPREESKAAVAECIRAGIRPIMITGDHKITAAAIAREIGILRDGTEAVEGAVIDGMSDEELQEFVPKVSVYARVSPEHKIRIVRAWQQRGNLVAMTGDGVNDAPALKQADIGVALQQARSLVYTAAADIPTYRRAVAQMQLTLCTLLGENPQRPQDVGAGVRLMEDYRPVDVPVGLPSELLERRPDIMEAYYNMEAAAYKARYARSVRFPSIALTGAGGVAGNTLKEMTSGKPWVWSAVGQITQPLFAFGKLKRTEQAAVEVYKQQVYAYEQTVIEAFADVEKALVAITTYRDQTGRTGELLLSNDRVATMTRALYRSGLSDYLDVIDAERSLYQTQMELVNLVAQQYINYVTLCKALGGGWNDTIENQE